MTRDLISVGQGGAAIIDKNTPEYVNGFCTYGLQTCVALFIKGSGKYALLHIDSQTSPDSIHSFIIDNFGKKIDYRLFFNPMANDDAIDTQILDLNKHKVASCLGSQLDPNKIFPTKANTLDGSLSINLRSKNISFDTNATSTELQERQTYDINFSKFRSATHLINEISTQSSTPGNLSPIDVQYCNSNYTELPKITQAGLSEDLDLLKNSNQEEIASWFLSPRTSQKYPSIGVTIEANGSLAESEGTKRITNYLQFKENCALTSYKIPVAPDIPGQERAIMNLSDSLGESACLTTPEEGNQHYSIKLRSKSLTKDIRDSLGLDRVKIHKPTNEQLTELVRQLPGLTFEAEKNEPGKFLLTFPKNEENRKKISEALKPPSATEAKTSEAIKEPSTTQKTPV